LGRDIQSEQSLIRINNRAEKLAKEHPNDYQTLETKNRWYLNVLELNTMLSSWQEYYLSLWRYPTLDQGIRIDKKSKQVIMENLTVHYPTLLKVRSDGKLSPEFTFNSRGRLQDRIATNNMDNMEKYAIWIDYCNYMDEIIHVLPNEKKVCLGIVNREKDEIYVMEIHDKELVQSKDIYSLLYKNKTNRQKRGVIVHSLSKILDEIDTHMAYKERCHSLNIGPLDIINKYASQDKLVLISAYKVDMNIVSKAFMHYMDGKKSTFLTLEYNDLYLGIVRNGELIVEKNSSSAPVKYSGKFDKIELKMTTEGLSTLFRSSIVVNGYELSPNYAGINMVVVDLKSGNTEAYNFPTHPQ
jgi:hypothetical protein